MNICPGCGNKNIVNEGKIPFFGIKMFGKNPLSGNICPGDLMWCPVCDLRYRYPYPDQDVLSGFYRDLKEDVWKWTSIKPLWKEITKIVQSGIEGDTILDVGCFCGDFLDYLDGDWHKLGIEPSMAAGKKAEERGITLIGSTVDDVKGVSGTVDVITLLDVLEHIKKPFDALSKLKRLLSPRGYFILFTGATNTLAYRIFKRHYWYYSLPEHGSFFSLKWFRWAAIKLGMKLSVYKYMSSSPCDRGVFLVQFLKLFSFTIIQQLREHGFSERILSSFPGVKKVAGWKQVPWWEGACDHILIVLRS